jgi:hypothetical protein
MHFNGNVVVGSLDEAAGGLHNLLALAVVAARIPRLASEPPLRIPVVVGGAELVRKPQVNPPGPFQDERMLEAS